MDTRCELQITDKSGNHRVYAFNELSELRERSDLNLTGVAEAQIITQWPSKSVIPNHPDSYVEVRDAVKYLKKRGFKFEAVKSVLREEKKEPEKTEEQKASETPAQKPAEESRRSEEQKLAEQKAPAKPEPKKDDGIYIVNRSEALVAYNGVEFVMPVLRHGKLSTARLAAEKKRYELNNEHASEFGLATKASSHRFNERGGLAMVGLDTILKTAESAQADLIAFAPSPRGATLSETGAYTFFRYLKDNPRAIFSGYDVAALKEKMKDAKTKDPTAQ